jgi:hypothetical protein
VTQDTCCPSCGSNEVTDVPGYGELMRVTSDAKPWPAGGRIAVCRACGLVQKPITPEWLAEVAQIYAAYTIYFQSGGETPRRAPR